MSHARSLASLGAVDDTVTDLDRGASGSPGEPRMAGFARADLLQTERAPAALGADGDRDAAGEAAPAAKPRARARLRPERTRADFLVCRVLCVPTEQKVGEDEVYSLFSGSILLSALRCLLTYVFLPILTPVLGVAAGVGPAIGIPLSIVALYFDVRGMRRFWLANHRWRWYISGVYLAVMVLVAMLLVLDVVHILR